MLVLVIFLFEAYSWYWYRAKKIIWWTESKRTHPLSLQRSRSHPYKKPKLDQNIVRPNHQPNHCFLIFVSLCSTATDVLPTNKAYIQLLEQVPFACRRRAPIPRSFREPSKHTKSDQRCRRSYNFDSRGQLTLKGILDWFPLTFLKTFRAVPPAMIDQGDRCIAWLSSNALVIGAPDV